jgi:hypothetical protein
MATITASRTVTADDVLRGFIENTVTCVGRLPQFDHLDNEFPENATSTCEVIGECGVAIIKESSCDSGPWGDGCTTLDENNVRVRYRYVNTEDVDLFNCTINETNTQIPDITIADKFDLPAGGTEVTNMRASDQCTTLEAGGEPDTATITCDCGDPINPFDTVSASDDSDFSCEDCVVTIDKQVSCDGTNYFDIGNDGDGLGQLPDCQELDGQGVHAQYIVDNTGDTDVRCTIGDSNDEFLIGSETTGTIPGQGGQYVSSRKDAVCSDVFDEKEPDTATLNCECLIDNEVVATRSDTDIANIECLGCDVKVDKAVSCAGEPFDDETLVFANEDLTNGCTALNDENITVNYRGQNVGEVGLFDCKIDESNTVLGTGMQTSFGISVNTTEGPFIDDDQDCSDPTLDDGEPDTATINCVCEDPAGDAILEGPVMVSAFDIADFICEEVPQGCRMTGGHNVMVTKKEGGDPQYDDIPSGTKYTTGGQIGAPDERLMRQDALNILRKASASTACAQVAGMPA